MEESQPSGSNGRIRQPEAFKSLYKAAKAGDVTKIGNILASNANEKVKYLLLSSEDESSGELPLHAAAREGHQEVLDLLLPQNLTNAQTSRDGWSALHFSAGCGQFKVVQWLVNSRKPDLNLQDKVGLTPLHLAVIFGHKEVVRFLVSEGANLFIFDEEEMFPVSFCKDPSMFDALLSYYKSHPTSFNEGKITEWVDAERRTILHYTAEHGSDLDVIVRLITEANPDHLYDKDKHDDSFLHVAAKSGNMKVLQALKKFDSEDIDMVRLLTNAERDCVNSPGMYALLYDHREFFDELLTMGKVEITLSCIIKGLIAELVGRPEILSRVALFASTLPTYLALYAKKDCIFDFLSEIEPLSLMSQWDDEYKRTCLHWAVVDKRTDIVQKLCKDVKLWPSIQDKDGKTALQHAFEQKNHMVMEILSANRIFKEHEEKLYRDREVYVQALNAILVGAALIASVTFAGWLQTPFHSEFESLAMKIYWASNNASFFTAVATMCVAKTALLPTPSRYVGDIVNQLRLALVIDAVLLALSLAAVPWAFAAAGFAALRHANISVYQVIMVSTTAVGGFLCLIAWLALVVQLINNKPSKSVLCALLLPSRPFGWLGTRWLPACLQNLRAELGASSRLGYPRAKRSEITDLMDKDLVEYCAKKLNPITHGPPASETITAMKQEASKLGMSDKFLDNIYQHREVEFAFKEKREGAIKRIECRLGRPNHADASPKFTKH
ncbi:hypothetical protein GOP47_0004574 [Adiantum capillus-veneris]|uniref:PGG domain-containing protein n=1 Tax=Adiantum capillus-veneris TaxID=13818 RepID=A0A9D4V7Q0_ADICA|nr:hypothetical protein GOP47_0004574 [Adiantum capillus-veneris]